MHKAPKAISLLIAIFTAIVLSGCGASEPTINKPQTHRFGFERITSFDAVQHGKQIDLLVAGITNKKTQIHYLHSLDAGQHWSQPVRVGTDMPAPHGLGHGSNVQIAAQGKQLVAVWPIAGEGWGGAGPLVSAVSSDGGQHWQAASRPAPGFAGAQGYADLLADPHGNLHLVWLDSRNGKQALYSAESKDHGHSWRSTQQVDAATCYCCTNELALSPDGSVLALYRDAKPRDMLLAQLDKNGQWESRSKVGVFDWHFSGCPEAGGQLVAAGNSLHALIWTGKPGASGVYHLSSSDSGQTWSAPQTLSNAASHYLAIAARGPNHLAAAWDTGMSKSNVVLRLSTDAGQHWSDPTVLEGATHPLLLTTEAGWRLIMLSKDGALHIVSW